MKIKILSLILATALLFSQVFVMPASAADTESGTGVASSDAESSHFDNATGFTYTVLKDGTAEITAFDVTYLEDTEDSRVNIPEKFGDYTVTALGADVFKEIAFNSVELPKTLKKVGENAFGSQSRNVYITDLKAYCNIEFYDSYSESELYRKSKNSFDGLYPESYPSPLGNIYLNGELLTELAIPDGVTGISPYAFANATAIESLTIPSSVREIGAFAFLYSGIESIEFANENGLEKIGTGAFSGTAVSEISLPEGVKHIGAEAFFNCQSLEKISLPKSLEYIGGFTFFDTPFFKAINNWDGEFLYIDDILLFFYGSVEDNGIPSFGGGIIPSFKIVPTSLSEQADGDDISDSSDTSEVQIVKEGTRIIGGLSFVGETLESLTIPSSVEAICDGAFFHCYFDSVTVNDGLERVGNYAFFYSGFNSIELPESVTSLGEGAFCGNDLLKSVVLSEGLKSIGTGCFSFCTALTEIKIPDSVTEIGYAAFEVCTALEEVTLPAGLGFIDEACFYECTSLKSIKVPDGVISLGEASFMNCTALETVTLPDGLDFIDAECFNGCSSLTAIEIPDSVTYLGEAAFSYCAALEAVKLPAGIEKIEYVTFYGCEALKKLEIPDSVTEICEMAFLNCKSLESVKLSRKLEKIDVRAFCNCSSLKTVNGANSLKEVGEMAFSDCTALKEIEFCAGLESIGEKAFYECSSLERVNFPEGLKSIGSEAFYLCSSLEEIVLPGSLKGNIGKSAFEECTHLTSVTMCDGITLIPMRCFAGDTGLTMLTISTSLEKIESNAILFSNKFKYVRYCGTEEEFDKIEIESYNYIPDKIYVCDCGSFDNCKWQYKYEANDGDIITYCCEECNKILFSDYSYSRGDLNADGVINSQDLAQMKKDFLTVSDLYGCNLNYNDKNETDSPYWPYDINCDKTIDLRDFVSLKRYLVEHLFEKPVN